MLLSSTRILYLKCTTYKLKWNLSATPKLNAPCPGDCLASNESTYASEISEDVYKRRSQRSKVKDIEKPFQIPIHEKTTKWKMQPLKLILIIILIAVFVTILYSPTVCHPEHISDSISR